MAKISHIYLSSKHKPRVYVLLQHRGSLSLGAHRKELGPLAFHWSIMVAPKNSDGADGFVYDVTDGPVVDEDCIIIDENPMHIWHFRFRDKVDLDTDLVFSTSVVARLMVGKVSDVHTPGSIEKMLRGIPVPRTNRKDNETGVSWTVAAVKLLQETKNIEKFEPEMLLNYAPRLADGFIADPSNSPKIVNYTTRRM